MNKLEELLMRRAAIDKEIMELRGQAETEAREAAERLAALNAALNFVAPRPARKQPEGDVTDADQGIGSDDEDQSVTAFRNELSQLRERNVARRRGH